MRTVIERNYEGKVNLVVDGSESPAAVATEYLAVCEKLFPTAPEPVEKPKPQPVVKKKEEE